MGQQPLQQQQQYYVTPPIPGAYALVRGEGTLAPTGYDPRGLNQPGPARARLPPHMIEEYPGRPNAPAMNYASKWAAQDAAVQAALQAKKDEEWNTPPTVPFLSPEKTAARRLSSEDLLARSPARSQFGQQAPYQLRLPGEEEMKRERGRLAAEALRQAEDARIAAEAVMRSEEAGAPREEMTLVAPAPPPKSVSPASAESRVKSQSQSQTQSQSPSPMPKAVDAGRVNAGTPPVVAGPQKPLERSDTITSAVSKMSSSGRGSPAVGAPGAAAAAAAAATVGATVGTTASGTAVAERRMSRIMPDHEEKIYDDSREGMIVVEDATVRRVNGTMIGGVLHEEDEGPKVKMSATSFPGDEWRPWIEEGEGL